MTVFFRADASEQQGTGHILRVCSIAEEFSRLGFEVALVGDLTNVPWVEKYVNSIGFLSITNPEDTSLFSRDDLLIVDSYNLKLSDPFLNEIEWAGKVVLVDDLTPSYSAEMYIHCGFSTTWVPPRERVESPFLQGLKYLPIRNSLKTVAAAIPKNAKNPIAQILIVGGGSDPTNFAIETAKFLSNTSLLFDAIVVSPYSLESERDFVHDARFKSLKTGQNYEEAIARSNLVFSAAGTSSWEFLACGLPLGLALAVSNQAGNYDWQVRKGLALPIAERDLDGKWTFNGFNVIDLVSKPDLRNKLKVTAHNLIGLEGASNITNAILRYFLN